MDLLLNAVSKKGEPIKRNANSLVNLLRLLIYSH